MIGYTEKPIPPDEQKRRKDAAKNFQKTRKKKVQTVRKKKSATAKLIAKGKPKVMKPKKGPTVTKPKMSATLKLIRQKKRKSTAK